jgi:hypothetical protein
VPHRRPPKLLERDHSRRDLAASSGTPDRERSQLVPSPSRRRQAHTAARRITANGDQLRLL